MAGVNRVVAERQQNAPADSLESLRACPRFAPSGTRRACSVWPHRRLAMFGAIRWLAQLIIVTDAATDITDLGDEAHLCNRRFVGTRPWPHVVNLSDFT